MALFGKKALAEDWQRKQASYVKVIEQSLGILDKGQVRHIIIERDNYLVDVERDCVVFLAKQWSTHVDPVAEHFRKLGYEVTSGPSERRRARIPFYEVVIRPR